MKFLIDSLFELLGLRASFVLFSFNIFVLLVWVVFLKVEEPRGKEVEPYAYRWDRTHIASELQEMYRHLANGEESKDESLSDNVSLAGIIIACRAFRKLAFLTLRDDSGTIQVCRFLYCENLMHVLCSCLRV